mmetsp:Transcript_9905/g.26143  ORF Transcript_9905/g.26143 Transcript_9905/m.26143 type:complete len:273 (+) Transcript_9905:394-1212(+)
MLLLHNHFGLLALGVGDDLLHELHDAACAAVLLVLLRGGWRRCDGHPWRLPGGGHLHQGLGHVELLQAGEGLLQYGNRRALVGHRLLEVCVLGLPILAGLLQAHLGLGDDGGKGLKVAFQRRDGVLQVRVRGFEVRFLGEFHLHAVFCLVKLLLAELQFCGLRFLLGLELTEHLVHNLFHLLERVEAQSERQRGEAPILLFARNAHDVLRRGVDGLVGHSDLDRPRARGPLCTSARLQQAQRLAEQVAGVVFPEDGDGLAERLDLFGSHLRA